MSLYTVHMRAPCNSCGSYISGLLRLHVHVHVCRWRHFPAWQRVLVASACRPCGGSGRAAATQYRLIVCPRCGVGSIQLTSDIWQLVSSFAFLNTIAHVLPARSSTSMSRSPPSILTPAPCCGICAGSGWSAIHHTLVYCIRFLSAGCARPAAPHTPRASSQASHSLDPHIRQF